MKKLFSISMLILMIMCFMPTAAFATESNVTSSVVASIGKQEYQSLNDAIEAAQDGDTIYILSDCNVEPIEIGYDADWTNGISIEGNGHTITGWDKTTESGGSYLGIDVFNKVKFNNIKFKDFGTGDSGTLNGATVIYGGSGCDITITNCSFENFNREAIFFGGASGGDIRVENCTFDCTPSNDKFILQKAFLIEPGTADSSAVIKNCKITNADSTTAEWTSAGIEIFSGTISIEDCTIDNCEQGVLVGREYFNDFIGWDGYDISAVVALTNTNISNTETALEIDCYNGGETTVKVSITGGNYEGSVSHELKGTSDKTPDTNMEKCSLTITGGTYTKDVTKYLASGYIATKDSNGKYTVGLRNPEKVGKIDVKENIEKGEAEVKVGEGVAESDKSAAEAVASSITANLNKVAKNITITSDDKKDAVSKLVAAGQIKLDENDNIVPYEGTEDVTITIIKQPYFDVEVTGITIRSTGSELKFDITPKYNLLATTDIQDATKTVTVSTGNTLIVNEDTDVKLKLPEGFALSGDKLLIKHDKSDKTVEYYTGTVSDDEGALYVEFTTNGFSPFTATTEYAASIGEGEAKQVYPSLQAAVDAAKNGDTIKLLKDGEKATVRRTVSFTVDPTKGDTEESYTYTITLGDGCTRKATNNVNEWNIVYTAPKSPVTGDNSELGLFAVAGLISAAAVALILNRKHSL